MGIELDLDLGKEEVNFRQRLWKVYKQLNAYGRTQVGDFDSWADGELKAFRRGRRSGHDYGNWIQQRNDVPDYVAKAEGERSRFVDVQLQELRFLFGSTHASLREQPGMRAIADSWWNGGVQDLKEGRAGTAWDVAPRMKAQLQEINQIAANKVQVVQSDQQALQASHALAVKANPPSF